MRDRVTEKNTESLLGPFVDDGSTEGKMISIFM